MPRGEKPQSEPEIIPPDHAGSQRTWGAQRTRVFTDSHGTEHVYVARVGPLGVILIILVTAILLAVMFTLLLGVFLIWLPLLFFFIAGAIIIASVRAFFKWLL